MRGRVLAAAWLSVPIVGLVGCASEPGAPAPTTEFRAAGPWAAAFADAFSSTSEYQRAVLRDGSITVSELREAEARTAACMLDLGYRYTTRDDGTAEAAPVEDALRDASADDANDAMARCTGAFSSDVTYLFGEVRRNPDKLDEARIAVACLRSAALVDDSYTEQDWREDTDDGRPPFSEWDPAAVQCRLDPLGLWRTP